MCGRITPTIPVGIKTIQEWISRTTLHELSEELNPAMQQLPRHRPITRNIQRENPIISILPPLLSLTLDEDEIITIPPDSSLPVLP